MKEKINLIVGFMFLIGFAYAGYKLLMWLGTSLKDIDTNIGASLIAAAATIITTFFLTSYNARRAKENVAFEAHKDEKAKIYISFLNTMIQYFREHKEPCGDQNNEKPINFLTDFSAQITIYGSPGVVKSFAAFRTPKDNSVGILSLLDKLLLEMRKDLGESNKGITALDLIGLHVVGGKPEIESVGKLKRTDSL